MTPPSGTVTFLFTDLEGSTRLWEEQPEQIFQLEAADLPREFPPLRGREARLLTLTGPGGTGKTRLSLQAAADLVDSFGDGVFFVNLSPVTDPLLVASAIAQALGVREAAERPLAETLAEYLRELYQEGAAMTLEEAIACALGERDPPSPAGSVAPSTPAA